MPTRFSHGELVDKALAALVAVMQADRPPDGEMLRFVLAFLYLDDRGPFDSFWREATRDRAGEVDAARFGHFQAMRAAYAAIARRHGRDYW